MKAFRFKYSEIIYIAMLITLIFCHILKEDNMTSLTMVIILLIWKQLIVFQITFISFILDELAKEYTPNIALKNHIAFQSYRLE